ncbi:MAG: hypothetical protein R2706_19070 [Acidimicrobiales bacterium]
MAETSAAVADEIADDGVYVAPEFDIDVAAVAAAVADARRKLASRLLRLRRPTASTPKRLAFGSYRPRDQPVSTR